MAHAFTLQFCVSSRTGHAAPPKLAAVATERERVRTPMPHGSVQAENASGAQADMTQSTGADVGVAVGAAVGLAVGTLVGAAVGALVGAAVGASVGLGVGNVVGAGVGGGVTTLHVLQPTCPPPWQRWPSGAPLLGRESQPQAKPPSKM